MEEAQLGADIDHAVSVGNVQTVLVAGRATRCGQEACSVSGGFLDIVAEGEECVRSTDDVLEGGPMSSSLFRREGRRNLLKVGLPLLALDRVAHCRALEGALDEEIDGIALLGPLNALLEGQRQSARVLAQPPVVDFRASQPCAMDPRLLPGSETHNLAVQRIGHGVGLGVLEREGGDNHVEEVLLRDGFLLAHNVGEEGFVNLDVIPTLLECDAVDLARLNGGGDKAGVHLEDTVLAALFLLEHLEGLGLIVGRDDAIRDFASDDAGCLVVALVRQSNDVAKRRHAVRASSTSIGRGQGGEFAKIINEEGARFCSRQGHANSGAGRGHVLERSSGR